MESQSQLPIYLHQAEITKKIKQSRTLVLSGKTGCGKSTQVPQIILNQFPQAKIAICQPRRLAATSLAYRVSQQTKTQLGDIVGYHIGMDNKSGQKTQIKYMTYGIFIQELLFNPNLSYTHIILDQVHERSLQMDFIFIALRKILDTPANKNIKLIVMSATINSNSFVKYFSQNKQTGQYIRPVISYRLQHKEQSRKNYRNRYQKCKQQQNRYVVADIFNKEGQKCSLVQLPDQNKYKIQQYFLDDIDFKNEVKFPKYWKDDDLYIQQSTYELAQILIKRFLNKKQDGDVLVFVPGMQQIKKMKYALLRNSSIAQQSIIEVHSAYSEELHQLLFVSQIKNKIIIATNIGESSITLPYCKVVIDFCLTRKNISVKMKDYSRFQTRLASKANLLQRSGRVGRTSDGQVYRLIQKSQFQELSDFQIPQIQCVKLEMAILRTKQIEYRTKSKLFQDPYQVFLNAIDPPSFESIHEAIQVLVQEQALLYESPDKDKELVLRGQLLKISRIGQFMVKMPCTLKISKMILFSLQVGITSVIMSIAAILMSPKKFFVHQQKMINVESFMQNMIQYDEGNFNDFHLRHKMFDDWKKTHYTPFRNQIIEKSEKTQQVLSIKTQQALTLTSQQIELDFILDQFCNRQISQKQKNWCYERATSPLVFRQILKIYETLNNRLERMKINVKDMQNKADNQLILLCLCYVYKNTIFNVQYFAKNDKKPELESNYVDIVQNKNFSKQQIIEYCKCKPQDLKIQTLNKGFLRIYASSSILAKFLLPRYYNKANKANSTPFFRYLASSEIKAVYPLTHLVQKGATIVTVLNQTINKSGIMKDTKHKYSLVGQKIFESKFRYFLGESAMIQKSLLLMIKILTTKDFLVEVHHSKSFINNLIFEGETPTEVPFLIGKKQLQEICLIRKYQLWQPNHKIQYNFQKAQKQKNILLNILRTLKPKPNLQHWNQQFDYLQNPQCETQIRSINQNIVLKETQNTFQYFEKYRKWKQNYYHTQYQNFKRLATKQISIVCRQCYENQYNILSKIESISAYLTDKKILDLNQYRGDWICQNNSLFCANKHHIGQKIDDDSGSLNFQNLLLYGPYCKTIKFTGLKEQISYMEQIMIQGIKQIQGQKQKMSEFECLICKTDDEACIIRKQQNQQNNFWKKVQNHMRSNFHAKNSIEFKATL